MECHALQVTSYIMKQLSSVCLCPSAPHRRSQSIIARWRLACIFDIASTSYSLSVPSSPARVKHQRAVRVSAARRSEPQEAARRILPTQYRRRVDSASTRPDRDGSMRGVSALND
jgi:hypothetical protein